MVAPTPPEAVAGLVSKLRKSFRSGKTRSLDWRKEQLRAMIRMLKEGNTALERAIMKDLRKDKTNTLIQETGLLMGEAVAMLAHIDEYVAPEIKHTNLNNLPALSQINSDPLGVVLVIGAWNYPVQLTLLPVVGAIAAGNAVAIR